MTHRISTSTRRGARRPAPWRLWGKVALAFAPTLLLAGEPPAKDGSQPVLSDQQIEQALQPAAQTRGFTPRGLMRRDNQESAPSVNLNIAFEYNSSALKPQASAQLKQLQMALSSASLGKNRFLVAGHTDARGGARYNKQLSLRRAEAVKGFLVSNGIDASRLQAVGYGSEHLLTPDRPDDPSNRRVEIRALQSSAP